MVAPGLDAFRVVRFKVALEAKDRLRLPEYKGSALRRSALTKKGLKPIRSDNRVLPKRVHEVSLFFPHTGPRGDGARWPGRSA